MRRSFWFTCGGGGGGGGRLVIKGTLPPDGIFFNKDRDAMNQTTKNGALYLCILIHLL